MPAWPHLTVRWGCPAYWYEGLSPCPHPLQQGRHSSPKKRMPHSISQDKPGAGAAWCCQSRRKTAISSSASPVPSTACPKREHGTVGRCPCLSLPSTLLLGKRLYSRQLPKEHSAQWAQLCQDLMRTKVGGLLVSAHRLPAGTGMHRQPPAQAGQGAPVGRGPQPGVM